MCVDDRCVVIKSINLSLISISPISDLQSMLRMYVDGRARETNRICSAVALRPNTYTIHYIGWIFIVDASITVPSQDKTPKHGDTRVEWARRFRRYRTLLPHVCAWTKSLVHLRYRDKVIQFRRKPRGTSSTFMTAVNANRT